MGLSAGQYLSSVGCFCSASCLTPMKWCILSGHTSPCCWGMSRLIGPWVGLQEAMRNLWSVCWIWSRCLAHEEVAVWSQAVLERKQVWFLLFSYSRFRIFSCCDYSTLTLISMPCFGLWRVMKCFNRANIYWFFRLDIWFFYIQTDEEKSSHLSLKAFRKRLV